MSTLDKLFWLFIFSVYSFAFIVAMDDLGNVVGYDDMKYVAIALLFGLTVVKTLSSEKDKENKKEE